MRFELTQRYRSPAPAVADEVVGATAVPVQATVVVAAEVAEPEPVVV